MSGHSKWANIKHRKGKADAVRGKAFTKIGREIALCVRDGGADPAANGKLRDIIAKAKAANMPNDTVSRSIKKAAGELGSINYEEIAYEGYGAGGLAVIVECVTDNRNRTASDIRHYFDKFGGNLGATGSVGWMFERKGLLVVERTPKLDEDVITMQALEAGAEDLQALDDCFEIYTAVTDFSSVREALEAEGLAFVSAELTRLPQNMVKVDDLDVIEKIHKLLDALDDMDDVQDVYHNGELPEEPEED